MTAAYFDSLDDLAAWHATHAPVEHLDSYQTARAYDPSVPRTLVCHDFRGGYTEQLDRRDYVFHYWHLIDIFIYFSHHRVSIPPASLIAAAHKRDTKVLGVLVFEHEAGQEDARKLVQGSNERSSRLLRTNARRDNPFATVSIEHADQLIDLAICHRFDGYLLNVEIDLGMHGRSHAREHAVALQAWAEYFSSELRRRIPGGEVIWYDAVTSTGALRWQNRLNDLNRGFADACGAIFTNYHWSPPDLAADSRELSHSTRTPQRLLAGSEIPALAPSNVFCGIDVWGRGQYGGGGLSTHLAAAAVSAAQLSIALFGQAWTFESSELFPDGVQDWSTWQETDQHLWLGSGADAQDEPALALLERERRKELYERLSEQERARFGACDVPHRPLSAYLTGKPIDIRKAGFVATGCLGSGKAYWHRGEPVWQPTRGWTEPSLASAFPSLAIPCRARQTHLVAFDDTVAWSGAQSLLVRARASDQPIKVACYSVWCDSASLAAFVIWQGPCEVLPYLSGFTAAPNRAWKADIAHKGWQISRAELGARQSQVTTSCELGVTVTGQAPFHIGALAIGKSDELDALLAECTTLPATIAQQLDRPATSYSLAEGAG